MFNPQEQEIIKAGRTAGKQPEEIETAIRKYRTGFVPTEPSGAPEVAKGMAKGAGDSVKGVASLVANGLPRMAMPSVLGLIPGLTQKVTDKAVGLKNKMSDAIGLSDKNLEATNSSQKFGKALEIGAELATPLAVSRLSRVPAMIKEITGADALITHVSPSHSVEDVARMADEVMAGKTSPEALKATTEAVTPKVSLTEKLAGLSPDVKARIKGKGQLMADYFNIMDARNGSDLVPTPLEYGTKFTSEAKTLMEKKLSETGSDIGSFRQKMATYQAPRESFNAVRQSFDSQLAKLNLIVRDGKVIKIPGKIAQTISDAEIKSIQALHDDLKVASQSPSLENLIDLRTKFDNKINFDKASRETSNSLDPLSRSVRKTIADVAKNIVGKSEAKKLDDYSQFMDAYNDLRSYTDRKAGGEFLLKRVFSERGGDPRAVMQTILKHTGIDLMDHAMMAKIVTELSGNPATQGLFRQEITKAGLDAVNLMKGNPTGAVATLLDMGANKLINARKIFKKAAR